MLHREIPFLRICAPLSGGVIAGLWFKPGTLFIILSAVSIICLLVVSSNLNKYQENSLFGLPFTLSLFLAGLLLYNHEKSSLSVLETENMVVTGTLSDYPEEKPRSFMLNVRMHYKLDDSGPVPLKGSMIFYLEKNSTNRDFRPGDRIIVRCTPAEITNRGNPNEFNYKFYMENHGVKYFSFISDEDVLGTDTHVKRNIKHRALMVRHRIIKMYSERGISEEMLPLVSALTLGEKSGLDQERKEIFIKAGIMHIMAVSGLHAVILSMFVLNLLYFLKRRFNVLRIILAVLFIWAFAFVTGLTPSVLRATLMFTFIQAGNLMHRRVNGINSVLASAFVLIIARPSVIFDAGFLLSYSAVIFIIAFYSEFCKLLNPANPFGERVWQSASVTTVAQMGTLPLTVMLFNRFPTWFLLTNIIIVPLSSLAIILGCILPVLYPLKPLSMATGFALDRLTMLTEFLTRKAASLPFSNIDSIGMTPPECIFMFASIFLIMIFLLKKNSMPVFWPVISIAAYLITGTVSEVAVKTSNELIVYNTPGRTNIGLRTGNHIKIFSDTMAIHQDISRHCSTRGIKPEISLMSTSHCIRAGSKNILICDGFLSEEIIRTYNPDIIIFGGPVTVRNRCLNDYRGNLVFTPGYSGRYPAAPLASLHFVRRSGAYISRLMPSD